MIACENFMERDNKNNSILSDAITEMIWTASHNNKDYGLQEAKVLSVTLSVPLSTIMKNTTAKSLQYECVYTITVALPHSKRDDGSDHKSAPAVIALCSDYLKGFVEDKDPNLKYFTVFGLAINHVFL